MKKILKNKKVIFIYTFLGFMAFMILMDKLFGFRSPPYSWEEVGDSMPFTIIGSLIFAIWVQIGIYGE